jgi:hypothetical protein
MRSWHAPRRAPRPSVPFALHKEVGEVDWGMLTKKDAAIRAGGLVGRRARKRSQPLLGRLLGDLALSPLEKGLEDEYPSALTRDDAA